MIEENEKVCCNCKHCIRSHDKMYDMTVCRCEKNDEYLSYAKIMGGSCEDWEGEQ